MAVISLDSLPRWFLKQSGDHMSADAARAFANTDGVQRMGSLQRRVAAEYCIITSIVLRYRRRRAAADAPNGSRVHPESHQRLLLLQRCWKAVYVHCRGYEHTLVR